MVHSHFTPSIAEQITFEQVNNYSNNILAILNTNGIKMIDKMA